VKSVAPLLLAMAVASTLILLYGESPVHVYGLILSRTWGDAYGLGQVVFRATPLVFTGLAIALTFRAGLFNIGAEGQLLLGSFATGIAAASLPAPLAIPAGLIAGAVGGGFLAGIAGVLRARFRAHEVITTIMLNFIASALVLWAGREAFFLPETVHTAPVTARLPSLAFLFGPGTSASVAFFLALAAAVGCHLFLFRTRPGFELRAFGKSPLAAEAGGVGAGRTIILAMTASGALAGLVGAGTVLGYKGYFEEGMGSGAGFMGIAVALLARNHPLAVIPAALFFGTLAQGGLAANALVPKEIIEVIQAVLILAAGVR
jgi:general nucleoside transport system permease protein